MPVKPSRPSIPPRSNSLDHVKAVLTLAKASLSGIGIAGVEAIPSVPLELISLYEAVQASQDDMEDLLVHLAVLDDAVLAPLNQARLHGTLRVPEDLRVRARELSSKLSECKDSVAAFVPHGFWQRFRKRTHISTMLRNTNRSISQAIAAFQLGGQIALELVVHDLGVEVHELRRDDDVLLSTLNPVNAGFRASQKGSCLPGTRVDLLRDIHHNLSDEQLVLVCLYGSPGTGKSAVAKTLAAELHDQGLLAASYFFDKRGGGAGNISLEAFVSTLAYQLAHTSPPFRATLAAQLKQDPLLGGVVVEERLEKLIINPLHSVPTPKRPFVIVLDALDECGDSAHQRRLVRLLRRFVEAPELRQRVTFLLTSRPEAAVTDTLKQHALSSATVVHQMDCLNTSQTISDVVLFVETRLREIIRDHPISPVMPPHDDVVQFAALGGGLFELAAVRIRQLESYCEDMQAPLDDAIRAVQRAARTPESGKNPLHEVYKTILRTAYDRPSRSIPYETLLCWYRSVVGALASLREPLPFSALCALVGMSETNARAALRPLTSVISMASDGPVYFFHASFLEFVLSEPPSRQCDTTSPSTYFLSSVQCHATLAKRCLVIMNESLCRNMLQLPNPLVGNDQIPSLPYALSQHMPRHLRYSCRYWADHLRVEEIAPCRDLLTQWCEDRLLYYIEALSILGELERAVPLLEVAERWVTKAEDSAPPATLLRDAQRLVQMFYPAIAKNAGAVYASAIPFMPSCKLYEQYCRLPTEGASLVCNRPSTWPAQIWAAAHPYCVLSVAASLDGKIAASGCDDGLIRIFSASTGRIEQILKGHTDSVYSVAFSSDAACVVSGSKDRTVRTWSISIGELERVLEGHAGPVNSVACSLDGMHIASASEDGTARIWSAATGNQERVMLGHTQSVTSVAFSSDSAQIVSGSLDHSVRVWSVGTGEQLQMLGRHDGPVNSVVFSSDDRHIASGANDHFVRIWSAASGGLVRALKGHTDRVNSVTFSLDDLQLISGSSDRSVRVWAVATGEQEAVLEGHSRGVTSVACFGDSTRIISGSNDRSARVWSATVKAQTCVPNRHSHEINSVAFSFDGSHVVSRSSDCSIRVWSVATGEQKRVIEGHCSGVKSVALSLDGHLIRATDHDHKPRYWDIATGERLNEGPPAHAIFSDNVESSGSMRTGWLPGNGLATWAPRHIQGFWWSSSRTLVIDPYDSRGSIAIIRSHPCSGSTVV